VRYSIRRRSGGHVCMCVCVCVERPPGDLRKVGRFVSPSPPLPPGLRSWFTLEARVAAAWELRMLVYASAASWLAGWLADWLVVQFCVLYSLPYPCGLF
jgi:hypothetical protein